MTTISIIVPIYQSEKYLQKCLESLLLQNLENYEIVCVDDGSTDGSTDIVKRMAAKFPCIHYYKQANQGVSAARNHGLRRARGKYVMFVDADDQIRKNSLGYLYRKIEKAKADILVFGGEAEPFLLTPDWVKEAFFTRNKKYVNCSTCALFHESGARPSVCNKLFRRKMISDSTFQEDIAISEDLAFLFDVFPKSQKVIFIDKTVYQYRISNNESAMHKIEGNKMFFFENHLRTIEHILKKWEQLQILKAERENLVQWMKPFLDYIYIMLTVDERMTFENRLADICIKLGADKEKEISKLLIYKEKEPMSVGKVLKSFRWQFHRYGIKYGFKSIRLKIAQFKSR